MIKTACTVVAAIGFMMAMIFFAAFAAGIIRPDGVDYPPIAMSIFCLILSLLITFNCIWIIIVCRSLTAAPK